MPAFETLPPPNVKRFLRALVHTLLFSALVATAPTAFAVPSFSRQTGMACQQCHTLSFGPALTQFGRDFKLNGYTLGTSDSVPISAMLITSFTRTNQKLPTAPTHYYEKNDNFSADELSLFYAGRVTDHIGSFAQITLSGVDRQVAWDNVDVRYADTHELGDHVVVAGLSVNNNPTTQDLWNSTPGWSYPYIGSNLAPSPAGAPLITDGLGQKVLGATGYAMIDNTYYVEAGAYHGLANHVLDALTGTSAGDPNAGGLIPYWRATVQTIQGANYLSLGTFGISAALHADPTSRNADRFTDLGVDATWRYADDSDNAFNANAIFIREHRHLRASLGAGASDQLNNELDSFNADLGYTWKQRVSVSAGVFDINGDRNQGLFPAESPIDGSANGSPNSRGYRVQLEYVPFGHMGDFLAPNVNVRLGVQYTGYTKFNGAQQNYDGLGRDAKDNNTLLLFAWFAF